MLYKNKGVELWLLWGSQLSEPADFRKFKYTDMEFHTEYYIGTGTCTGLEANMWQMT